MKRKKQNPVKGSVFLYSIIKQKLIRIQIKRLTIKEARINI